VERNYVLVSVFLQRDCGGAYLTASTGTVRCLGGEDPSGSGSTPPGVQVLQGGVQCQKCIQPNALSSLQSPPVLRRAVAEQGCQDALHRTSVEGLKDPPGGSEFPQLPEVVEALLRLSHQSVNVCSPCQILCDVDSQVAAHPLHSIPINPPWCVSPLMLLCPPISSFVLETFSTRLLSWHQSDRLT